MEHDDVNQDPLEQDPWESFENQTPEPEIQPKRRRLNPTKIRKVRGHRNLPAKMAKEMTLRKAKKLMYGARTPGRPSRGLSQQLREAKRLLQSAGLPLQKTKKMPTGRSRGRPKKPPVLKKEKRPRGRPKKPASAITKPKRPRGRPRKHTDGMILRPKKPRGRPRKNPLQQLVDTAKKKLPKDEA